MLQLDYWYTISTIHHDVWLTPLENTCSQSDALDCNDPLHHDTLGTRLWRFLADLGRSQILERCDVLLCIPQQTDDTHNSIAEI